ncbi:MAG: hypothetical protein B6I25_05375 [Planctomycetales bacterium 4572_13]|nr:MAG: hypothetical protein B6I25_05375 [Planctomycetales bacterium 4572_13]
MPDIESQQLEYKKSFGKETIVSLVAFANTDGGKVVIGVEDSGRVCGVELANETVQKYLNEIKQATYPQLFPKVFIEEKDDKQILIFEISEFPVKPVACKGRYYKRVQNSNHLLSVEEIVDLQQQSLSVSFDAYPAKISLKELDKELIERFFLRVNEGGRMFLTGDIAVSLTKLGLLRGGQVSIAAKLLFGDPERKIRIGRFKSEATIIDDNIVDAPLFSAVEQAMVFIKKHINLSYDFDGSLQRKERWQYPIEALRELLLNTVVHRDYKNLSDIIVKIFDDRIVFTNPGTLYGRLKVEDLQRDDYTSSIRNKLIAEAFYLTGDIEKYGTGFVRIREYMRDYPEVGLDIQEKGDFFWAQVRLINAPAAQVTLEVAPQAPRKHPASTPQVVDLLEMLDKPLSRRQLQEKLGLKDREHFRKSYLQPALDEGLIAMCNPDKPRAANQKYSITEKGKRVVKTQNDNES